MILDEQQLIKNILLEYFLKAQERNSLYSVRSFAKKLDISSSSLSEILRGKRKISRKKAMEFAEKLGLDAKKSKQLNDVFEKSKSLEKLKPAINPLKEVVLTPEIYHLMSDRVYFSILAMLRSKTKTAEQIARKLNLNSQLVNAALEELRKLGILTKRNEEYIESDRVVFRTPEDFPRDLITQRRLQNNTAARIAMENQTQGEQGYFATVSLDRSKLSEIEPIIEDFMKRLCLFIRKPESEDVFEINIDIFPWSN